MRDAHRRKRAVAVLGVMLACSAIAFALDPSLDIGQYAHTSWKLSEGFCKGRINAIAQTPDGYLWLATEFGLVRFDGVRTVAWQPPAGERLPSNEIRGLIAGRDGTLWIGTGKGLVSWKNGKLTHYPEFDKHDVGTLLEDREGTVWAAGALWEAGPLHPGQVCAINSRGVQCYGSDGSFGFAVTALYEDRQGNLWLGAANGLWRWKPGPPKHFPLPELPHYGKAGLVFPRKALMETGQGAFLISGPGGVFQFMDGRLKPYSPRSGAPLSREGELLRDRNGDLWLGTFDAGLLHVHQGRVDTFTQADGLSSNSIENLFEDREGNIWISTTNGLDRFRDYAVATASVKQGLSHPVVASVLATRDGSVWLATPDGLNRWKDGQVTVFRKPTAGSGLTRSAGAIDPSDKRDHQPGAMVREISTIGLPDNDVGSLYQERQGRIWISTAKGLATLEDGRFTPLKGVHLPGWFLSPVARDSIGNLWTTSDEGLYRLSGEKMAEYIPSARMGLRGSLSTLLVTDPVRGGLWVASWQGGVVHFKDGQVRSSYGPADGLGEGRVNALQLDPDGTLWAATDGGLSRISDGRVATLSSRNGLPCDPVHGVIEDDAHSVWLYMACGLVRIARTELDAWVANPKRQIQTRVFDNSDGVKSHPGVLQYAPRMTKAADGKLWFVPLEGVSVVDPHHLPWNSLPPPVHIEQITADRKTYYAPLEESGHEAHVRLPPQVRDLEIDYTALSFVVPEKVLFRYKLEGWDRDWQDVGNRRQAFYTNLSPGTYRFRVIACNNSGVWNEAGTFLDFSIAPRYYQTKWFLALSASTVLAVLWMLYQWRIHHLRHQERQLREVINAVPANIWSSSPDGQVDFVNQGWQELTGLLLEDAGGWNWQAALHPNDRAGFVAHWHAAIKNGKAMEHEVRVRRSDGQYRWLFVRNVPLRDNKGNIVKWYGTSFDIDDRKGAEESLRQAQADLAHTNRMSMMGELAASLAHEIKQPIAAGVSNAEACLLWLEREQPDLGEVREAATEMVREAKRAAEIIDRLRSFYKTGAPPERELVDMNEVIREMLALLRTEANRYSVSMRADLAAEVPKVMADRIQLQQVFMNLMLNGMESMADTGGELTIKSERTEDGQLQISISDTGAGISEEKINHIFDAFFTTKPQGSGMGLTITKSIIEAHGGRLWVSSNIGRGATFYLVLPVATTAS